MAKFFLTFLSFTLVYAVHVNGQQQPTNFLVNPGQVNCDSLEWSDESADEAIVKIRAAGFRFQQSISINRSKGFQETHYYSCDNEVGFMIVKFDDTLMLYRDIPKDLWDKMAESGDPEVFFTERFKEAIEQWKQTAQ